MTITTPRVVTLTVDGREVGAMDDQTVRVTTVKIGRAHV